MMSHDCHAVDCTQEVKPEMLMCFRHWRMVPTHLQRLVWRTYRPGQCDDLSPSAEYCDAAKAAVVAVAYAEGKQPKPDHPKLQLYDCFKRAAEELESAQD